MEKSMNPHKNFRFFLENLYIYLKLNVQDRTQNLLHKKTIDIAMEESAWKQCAPTMYHFFFEDFDKYLPLLEKGDKAAWAILLILAVDEREHYIQLRSISPFGDSLLVFVDFLFGRQALRGDLMEFVIRLLRDDLGVDTSYGASYVVSIPEPNTLGAEVLPTDSRLIEELMAKT